jgi:hypothetical protein
MRRSKSLRLWIGSSKRLGWPSDRCQRLAIPVSYRDGSLQPTRTNRPTRDLRQMQARSLSRRTSNSKTTNRRTSQKVFCLLEVWPSRRHRYPCLASRRDAEQRLSYPQTIIQNNSIGHQASSTAPCFDALAITLRAFASCISRWEKRSITGSTSLARYTSA